MAKLLMYDFACGHGHSFEKLVRQDETTVPCIVCNNPSSRKLATPTINLEGWSLSFPTAADRWARNHEEAAKIASKRES
jgi:hypothetical protein